MTKLTELVEMIGALKKKMQEDGQTALNEAFKEFFASHPEAKEIVWVQYTPWFNAGDACVFRLGNFELHVDPELVAADVRPDVEAGEYSHADQCYRSLLRSVEDNEHNRRYSSQANLRNLTSSESSIMNDFNELEENCHAVADCLQIVFDDHVKVVATREGFSTDEFDHD